MIAYRRHTFPVIYSELTFVRKWHNLLLADCPEDLDTLNQLKKVASGHQCVSALEWPEIIFVKCEIPDDIFERVGTTGDALRWRGYGWKTYDVGKLFIADMEPAEATPLHDAGIDAAFLKRLSCRTSCIPLLRKTEALLTCGKKKGYTLTKEMEFEIERLENRLFAALDLEVLKGGYRNTAPQSRRSKSSRSISVGVRDRILRRDGYRCLFCGRNRDDTTLEVNHIIPKSLIAKLHLKRELFTADENLCVTCFDCNRGKSDNLAQEDVSFYIHAFSSPCHPNHGVVEYLRAIREVQAVGEA
ncbi:MAG: HNH endonuclease signature motif containing protein [Planctomycetia bacterium]|nr:HNH endonuclease signature motif containing protein [Planctomycetia bacterium]